MDLRTRVIAALDEGETSFEVAARFGVHDSWVRKLRRRREQTGSVEPSPHGGGRDRTIDEEGERYLRAFVEGQSDATLLELRGKLAEVGKPASITSVWRALARLGLTLK